LSLGLSYAQAITHDYKRDGTTTLYLRITDKLPLIDLGVWALHDLAIRLIGSVDAKKQILSKAVNEFILPVTQLSDNVTARAKIVHGQDAENV